MVSLSLQLTPMQQPDALQPSTAAASQNTSLVPFNLATNTNLSGCDVVVYPREPSEILLQLENLGDRSLNLRVQIEGNFPSEWCSIHTEPDRQGPFVFDPKAQMSVVLCFNVPEDFFEKQAAITLNHPLMLDFHCRIHVYYTEQGTNRQFVETGALNLYVRPRSLYLKFIPALYREVDFIGRFLKIFEQAFEPTVQTLDVLWSYLDPMTAPQALLPFLAHWVAWPIDQRWSLTRQRFLIRSAVELYRWRGTKRGLRLYLHLYTDLPLDDHLVSETDKHICIEEIRGEGFVLGNTRIGQDAMIGGGRPYHFIVRLRPQHPNQIDEQLVRHIIEQEKPAFCTYELYVEQSIVNSQ
ncbi:phage tail protein [Nostoc sp. CMAA1605]|uniref:phage tail protein n=1 Tax=Nostoc sp. CMAA1605 TaxID=2055159 RepID=UPI001F197648|nr:phage tail protein [Nostoc sp. CMAA1605]MCF4969150.1 phage tail protein [Nostoc sp. CMAA1605]